MKAFGFLSIIESLLQSHVAESKLAYEFSGLAYVKEWRALLGLYGSDGRRHRWIVIVVVHAVRVADTVRVATRVPVRHSWGSVNRWGTDANRIVGALCNGRSGIRARSR